MSGLRRGISQICVSPHPFQQHAPAACSTSLSFSARRRWWQFLRPGCRVSHVTMQSLTQRSRPCQLSLALWPSACSGSYFQAFHAHVTDTETVLSALLSWGLTRTAHKELPKDKHLQTWAKAAGVTDSFVNVPGARLRMWVIMVLVGGGGALWDKVKNVALGEGAFDLNAS